jgi:hypothetical protein
MNSILKYCPKCKQEKPIETAFNKNKARYDGVAPICKRCRTSNKKRFDAKELGLEYCPKCDQILTYKEYYGPNVNKRTSYCLECRTTDIYKTRIKLAENGIKICASCGIQKSYLEFHKDKNRSDGHYSNCKSCESKRGKKKYKNNAKKINKRHSKNYYKKKKYYQEKHKEWYFANPGYSQHRAIRRRALERKAEGSYTQEEFETLCQRYGNICLCCGKRKKLSVDHIVPLSKGGKNSIDNIQPLCITCNKKKATKTIDYRPMAQVLP